MADRDARPHRNGQRVANRLGRHHRQGRHVGACRGLTGPVAGVVDRHASAGATGEPSDEVGPVPICRRCTRSGADQRRPLAERGGSTIDWRSSFWPRRGRAEGGGRKHLDTAAIGRRSGAQLRAVDLRLGGSRRRGGGDVAWRQGGGPRTVFLAWASCPTQRSPWREHRHRGGGVARAGALAVGGGNDGGPCGGNAERAPDKQGRPPEGRQEGCGHEHRRRDEDERHRQARAAHTERGGKTKGSKRPSR